MVDFLVRVADILETESITLDTEFRMLSNWDSLRGFSLLIMLEREYNLRLTPEAFMACKTVRALAQAAHIID